MAAAVSGDSVPGSGNLGGLARLGAVVTAAVGVASVSSAWSDLGEPRPLVLGDSQLGGEPGSSARFLLRARRSGVELLGPAVGPLIGFPQLLRCKEY